KVVDILENRVGAKVVPQYMEDLTPQEEYDKVEFVRMMNMERRDPGTGRPTKKERREIDRLKDRY
ncbi:MAG: RNA-binding S4 domain-containing protein, partial [Bacteroidales bacterium]|nr:RNA-binding S4 domain-containing protein [Bacteroidales bacterium]